jgi:type VI secretion system Hcp family effector
VISALGKRAVQILLAGACVLLGTVAHAQSGYMRVITSTGRQMAGESIDPAHNGWIPFRSADMPSAADMASVAAEKPAADPRTASKAVHRPVVVVKERDKSSLPLLEACTTHQVLPEVQIAFTDSNNEPTVTYKLTDASVISIRAGDTNDGTEVAMEKVRFNYAKIEVVK